MTQDRAQLGPTPVFPMIVVAVTLVSVTVGLEIMNASAAGIEKADFQTASDETVTVCGLGCGADPWLLPKVLAIVVVIAVALPILRAAASTLKRRKEYPANTIERNRRWTDRKDMTAIRPCINCETADTAGSHVTFGTERILFGFVTQRTVIGEFHECTACANASTIDYARRARGGDGG